LRMILNKLSITSLFFQSQVRQLYDVPVRVVNTNLILSLKILDSYVN
jgi:hypothetical protein